MTTGITKSVGKGGVNLPDDVGIVRQLLAAFVEKSGKPPLVTGPMDPPTIEAITHFQAQKMQLAMPDGRVDPDGKTIKALLEDAAKPVTPAPLASGGPVTYGAGVAATAQLVSPYAIKVIERALAAAGMKAAVITSTLRPPAEQAAAMYKNASINFQKQFGMYAAPGKEVLQVFSANKSKPKATVIALMTQKIEELVAANKRVSLHVTTPAAYAKRNIIDVGVNSTRNAAGGSFNLAGLTKAFKRLQADGFIAKFIDETAQSNNCWHIEIVPDAKPL